LTLFNQVLVEWIDSATATLPPFSVCDIKSYTAINAATLQVSCSVCNIHDLLRVAAQKAGFSNAA